jgi:predicted permease
MHVLDDLRAGLRGWLRTPVMTTVALLTLALGIGASTTMFTLLNALLYGSNPFPERERIVTVHSVNPAAGAARAAASHAEFAEWRQRTTMFSSLVALRSTGRVVHGPDCPLRVESAEVTSGFFEILGAQPAMGTHLDSVEDLELSVVISWSLWMDILGSDPGAVGTPLDLDGRLHTIVGVMPEEFWFPAQRVDAWVHLEPGELRQQRDLTVIGRLAPRATAASAEAELEMLSAQWQRKSAGANEEWGVDVVRPGLESLDAGDRLLVYLMYGAGVLVLLVACANLANILLARGAARSGETALRAALGARPSWLLRQHLTESLVLAVSGGALALPVAVWTAYLIISLLPASISPSLTLVDSRVLVAAIASTLLSLFGFALLPAIQALRIDCAGLVAARPRGNATASRHRWAKALVVAQVALVTAALIVAGTFVRTMVRIEKVDLGFDASDILTFRIDLQDDGRSDLLERALMSLRGAPGVQAAAAVDDVPFTGGSRFATFQNLEESRRQEDGGTVDVSDEPARRTRVVVISPSYLEVLRLPLLRGRPLSEADQSGAAPVALVNESFARRHFPGEEAIGQRLLIERAGAREEAVSSPDRPTGPDRPTSQEGQIAAAGLTIVGVVGDERRSHPVMEPRPILYLPHAQNPLPSMAMILRVDPEVSGLAAAIRSRLAQVVPGQPVYELFTLEEILHRLLAVPRTIFSVLAGFAALGLLLAMAGAYGVVAFTVQRRTHEYGVRKALGATPSGLFTAVIQDALRLTGLGLACGLAVASTVTAATSSVFYGVLAFDPVVFLGVPTLLVLSALFAALQPAHRASQVDPMAMLRAE